MSSPQLDKALYLGIQGNLLNGNGTAGFRGDGGQATSVSLVGSRVAARLSLARFLWGNLEFNDLLKLAAGMQRIAAYALH